MDSDEKCAVIKEKCGVDVALNYKSRSFREDYEKATPGCVDIYFDNVGGEILDMNLDRLAKLGRVVACGPVSSCDDTAREKGMVISAKGYEDIVSLLGDRLVRVEINWDDGSSPREAISKGLL